MTDIEKLITHIIKWEAGLTAPSLTNERLFDRARPNGYACVRGDSGGPTMIGVTLSTYADYCRKHGLPKPDTAALKAMPYAHWRDICKSMFWDKCKADRINSQSVAEMLVDWVWLGGAGKIKRVQKALRVAADGVVGEKTLAAINGMNPLLCFGLIRDDRIAYANAARKGRNARFADGWINRANDIKWKG